MGALGRYDADKDEVLSGGKVVVSENVWRYDGTSESESGNGSGTSESECDSYPGHAL